MPFFDFYWWSTKKIKTLRLIMYRIIWSLVCKFFELSVVMWGLELYFQSRRGLIGPLTLIWILTLLCLECENDKILINLCTEFLWNFAVSSLIESNIIVEMVAFIDPLTGSRQTPPRKIPPGKFHPGIFHQGMFPPEKTECFFGF